MMNHTEIFLLCIRIMFVSAFAIAIVRNFITALINKKSIKYALKIAKDTIMMTEYEFAHKHFYD